MGLSFVEVLLVNFVLGRQGNGEEWQKPTGRIPTEINLAFLVIEIDCPEAWETYPDDFVVQFRGLSGKATLVHPLRFVLLVIFESIGVSTGLR